MAKSLTVTFYPNQWYSIKLQDFLKKLRVCLASAGVTVVTYDQALKQGRDGRVEKGIVLFAPGEGESGNLAIDHVASLSQNTVVSVLDGTSPGIRESQLQKRINALVSALVWHMAHVVIYVDDTSWTICNMNGAIDTFSLDSFRERVADTLIPKLAAPVVPPKLRDFEVYENDFDVSESGIEMNIRDMLVGSHLWGETGLLASQTRIDSLVFRNSRYRKIASAYLSWRTGMSYGFLARQLHTEVKPALSMEEAAALLQRLDWEKKDFIEIDGNLLVAIMMADRRFLVKVPEVSVLCTRSGCEKTALDPAKDIVRLTLRQGRVSFGTPSGLEKGSDCQPSFDTMTILAHAAGNSLVASLLERLRPHSRFAMALRRRGLALAHWHGSIDLADLPLGYYSHGQSNPPVSCSTPQSAIFALSGKLSALERSVKGDIEYLGDLHIEPSHGANLSGRSLCDLAYLIRKEMELRSET